MWETTMAHFTGIGHGWGHPCHEAGCKEIPSAQSSDTRVIVSATCPTLRPSENKGFGHVDTTDTMFECVCMCACACACVRTRPHEMGFRPETCPRVRQTRKPQKVNGLRFGHVAWTLVVSVTLTCPVKPQGIIRRPPFEGGTLGS